MARRKARNSAPAAHVVQRAIGERIAPTKLVNVDCGWTIRSTEHNDRCFILITRSGSDNRREFRRACARHGVTLCVDRLAGVDAHGRALPIQGGSFHEAHGSDEDFLVDYWRIAGSVSAIDGLIDSCAVILEWQNDAPIHTPRLQSPGFLIHETGRREALPAPRPMPKRAAISPAQQFALELANRAAQERASDGLPVATPNQPAGRYADVPERETVRSANVPNSPGGSSSGPDMERAKAAISAAALVGRMPPFDGNGAGI
jgi:hypothetical protein